MVGRASGLAMTHCHRDFTVCSCSSLPVLLPGDASTSIRSKCSTTADVSGEPVMRNARANARRRIAACKHCWSGCNHAPRPGRLPALSTVTAHSPFPADTATTRSSSTASSRLRQPMHVRTGPSVRRCAEAEVSRWITAQSTVTSCANRNARPADLRVAFFLLAALIPGPLRSSPPKPYLSWTAPWVAPGFDGLSGCAAASLRMSMRQPVRRAASRAF